VFIIASSIFIRLANVRAIEAKMLMWLCSLIFDAIITIGVLASVGVIT
jgi:hypothetical protein